MNLLKKTTLANYRAAHSANMAAWRLTPQGALSALQTLQVRAMYEGCTPDAELNAEIEKAKVYLNEAKCDSVNRIAAHQNTRAAMLSAKDQWEAVKNAPEAPEAATITTKAHNISNRAAAANSAANFSLAIGDLESAKVYRAESDRLIDAANALYRSIA